MSFVAKNAKISKMQKLLHFASILRAFRTSDCKWSILGFRGRNTKIEVGPEWGRLIYRFCSGKEFLGC